MIYKAKRIFTGHHFLDDHSIIVEDGHVADIVPSSVIGDDTLPLHDLIAPSFIDLQIYGAGGKLLAVYPEADSLFKLRDYCIAGGANHFMPTVATNTYEVFYRAIDAVKSYWNAGGEGALGLHVEGPWINVLKRGAHLEHCIHSPSVEQVLALLEYGKGVIKMITLAPEVCDSSIVDLIASYGIVVMAGHSNATFAEGSAAFDKNIPGATHLFNAMSVVNHREPGLPVAVMNHDKVMCSIIPDNIHVSYEMLKLAKKVMGDRLFIITDAVTETSSGPYPHTLQGDRYMSNGILSGSALDMMMGVRNCVRHCGIELGEALRMASYYPARLMGMEGELGVIRKGVKANLVFVNEHLDVEV
ncbi:MAG: N-acetylglucosamine-6-phosphate deacetylase [Ginsengibacter sp.]